MEKVYIVIIEEYSDEWDKMDYSSSIEKVFSTKEKAIAYMHAYLSDYAEELETETIPTIEEIEREIYFRITFDDENYSVISFHEYELD